MVSTFTATSPVPQLENPDNLKAVDYLSRHEKYGFIPNGTTGEKHEGNKQETSQDLIPVEKPSSSTSGNERLANGSYLFRPTGMQWKFCPRIRNLFL